MILTSKWLRTGALMACLLVFLPIAAVRAEPVPQGEASAMMDYFKLEGEAKKKFLAGVEEWHKDIMKIQAGVQKDINELSIKASKARDAKQTEELKKLEAQIDVLNKEYWRQRGEARLKILNTFTSQQLSEWMTELLRRKVEGAVQAAMPTAAQIEAIRNLCAQEIAAALKEKPNLVKEDPYFRTLGERVGAVVSRAAEEVFTEEQAGRMVRPGKDSK